MSDSKQRSNDESPAPLGGRLAVFSVKQGANGAIWVRAGSAWANRDGSLDVLPLDGKLHIRSTVTAG